MMQAQTKDPVIAVLLRDQESLNQRLLDHELRIRPLENLASKLTVLSFFGAAVGAALINFLFQQLGVH